jgi:N utilization substance protein A
VRIDEMTGTAEVIVPDYQLSLAIGKEGQNARLAARLSGWRVDIKSETQLAEEEAYQGEEWAQGEWVVDAATGEQVWQPADDGDAMSADQWAEGDPEPAPADGTGAASTEAATGEAGSGSTEPTGAAPDDADAVVDATDATDALDAPAEAETVGAGDGSDQRGSGPA